MTCRRPYIAPAEDLREFHSGDKRSAALCAPCAAAAIDRQATSYAGAGVRLGCRRRDGSFSNCRLGLIASQEKTPGISRQLSTVFQPVRVAYSPTETNSSIY